MQKPPKKAKYVAEPQMICFSLRLNGGVSAKAAQEQIGKDLRSVEGIGNIAFLKIGSSYCVLPFLTGGSAKRARTLLRRHPLVHHEAGSDTQVEGYKINTVGLLFPEDSDEILRIFDRLRQPPNDRKGE